MAKVRERNRIKETLQGAFQTKRLKEAIAAHSNLGANVGWSKDTLAARKRVAEKAAADAAEAAGRQEEEAAQEKRKEDDEGEECGGER